MDPNQEIEDLEVLADDSDADDSESVDDFIRALEEKEKDLHITVDTTIIEIEQGFDDGNPAVFLNDDEPKMNRRSTDVVDDEAESVDLPFVPDIPEPDDAPVVAGAIQNLEEQVEDLEEQIVTLTETNKRLEDEKMELMKTSIRRAKDFESFKSRTERERSEKVNEHVGDVASQLLPALDNLDRAIESAESIGREKSTEFDQFFQGIVMVNRQLREIFSAMGVVEIPAVGEPFDPHLHEAVAAEESSEHPANTIIEELLRGYRIGEKVIRHSMVKVAKSGTAKSVEEAEPEPAEPDDAAEISEPEDE